MKSETAFSNLGSRAIWRRLLGLLWLLVVNLVSIPIAIAHETDAELAFDCYVVKSSKQNWKPVLDYFEISTGLHRGTRKTIAIEQGELQVETTYQDYRDVAGIKMSYVSVQKLGTQALEFRVTSFKVDPKVASDVFGVLAWKCGSIWPSILCHLFINSGLNLWRVAVQFLEIPEQTRTICEGVVLGISVVCFGATLWLLFRRPNHLASL